MGSSKTKINFTTFLISCCLAVGNTLASSFKATAVQLYETIDFSDGFNHRLQSINPDFPSGNLELGNVPFDIPNTTNNIWHSRFASGPNPRTLTVDVGLFGVTEVHTLINTFWGKSAGLASIEFHGSDDAYYKKTLYGNSDIRDWNQSPSTNRINNTTTVEVFSDPRGPLETPARLDKQLIDLPVTFNDEELSTIIFKDWGDTASQRIFVSGITAGIATDNKEPTPIPEPSNILALISLIGLSPIFLKKR